LLDENNVPFLCDFGISVKKEEVQPNFAMAGTLAYMSPEQLRGEGHLMDGRSDIFSLGVVLYELLTGRVPSDAAQTTKMVNYLSKFEFDPPSAIRSDIPDGLERICLKALSPVIGDRYQRAAEMARDLVDVLDFELVSEVSWTRETSPPEAGSTRGPTRYLMPTRTPKLLPKGLLPFDRADHLAFLSLLPGPKDSEGLPESVRFWKHRILGTEGETTLRVGLIHGCSGSGKSSLVRAGILPRLRDDLIPIYVDATQGLTSQLMGEKLREHCPEIPPDATLKTMLQMVRLKGEGTQRFLIVIDQLEQCFDREGPSETELVTALRQCDGKTIQALLVVRDEFWPEAARFMDYLEQPIRMGENCRGIEPFSRKHAASVMYQLGHALEKFPENQSELSQQQRAFIDLILEELAQSDQLQPVHLTLAVEMLREREWTEEALQETGGLAGLGHRYLRSLFTSRESHPGHRELAKPVASVLDCLTPADGGKVRGPYKTIEEITAWVPQELQPALAGAIAILRDELKLIVPGPIHDEDGSTGKTASYQLTHDCLVPAVREWLASEEEGSGTGRARQRLKEVARQWRDFHDTRRLPTLLEFAEMVRLTNHQQWSTSEAEVMRVARWRLARKAGGVMAVACLVVGIIWGVLWTAQWQQNRLLANAAVQHLLSAQAEEVPEALSQVRRFPNFAKPFLHGAIESGNPEHQVRALMVDTPAAQDYHAEIGNYLLTANPAEIRWLAGQAPPLAELHQRLAEVCLDDENYRDGRLRAAAFLAQAAPKSVDWNAIGDKLATDMVAESSGNALAWAELLWPVRRSIADRVEQYYISDTMSERGKSSAAAVLGVFYRDNGEQLAKLLEQGNAAQIRQLFPVLQSKRVNAIQHLARNLADMRSEPDNPVWYAGTPVDPAAWDPALREELASYGLLAQGKGTVLYAVPLDRLEDICRQLAEHDLHPVTARVRREEGKLLAMVGFVQDARADHRLLISVTADEIKDVAKKWIAEEFHPYDIAEIPDRGNDDKGRFLVLWRSFPGEMVGSSIYVEVPENRHADHWGPLNEGGFVPRVNLQTQNRAGEPLYSSIRWKLVDVHRYFDTWGTTPQKIRETNENQGWQQIDIRHQSTLPVGENVAAIWWSGGQWQSECLIDQTQAEHQRDATQLAGQGYFPRSVSVEQTTTGEWKFSSLWIREWPSYELVVRRARRRASLVVGLFQLGERQLVWEALSSGTEDTNFRTATIHLLADLEIDPKLLLDKLETTDNVELQFCLLETLALYPQRTLYPANLDRLASILKRLVSTTRDSGVLSMCQTVARRHLGQAMPESEPDSQPNDQTLTWHDAPNGHRLVEITPGEFLMGSPGNEPGRNHLQESPVRRRIDRRYAIATLETTVAQFREFDSQYSQYGQFRTGLDFPAVEMDWWRAQAYCRWLSEQEGIPEDQMCYPPIDEINVDMKLPSDFFQREGYRLPTEAEWEYACRAGTTTSGYFGDGAAWGESYAWTSENARYQAWPVGMLLPNRFGLHDMHGNAREWCLDLFEHYRTPLGRVIDRDDRISKDFSLGTLRPSRGGYFLVPWEDSRSAKRFYTSQELKLLGGGFRIVRTLPEPE
ncbi:MAG: SUMF1/EgtB/PvdO family nonheme iron enzyme, partial [Pirellulaceae bacterium]